MGEKPPTDGDADYGDLLQRAAPPAQRAATGLLLSPDGAEPVVGCEYALITDPSEPMQSMQVLGKTANNGAWTLEVGGDEGPLWVAFLLHAYCRVAYRISGRVLAAGGLVLHIPETGVCEIGIGDPKAAGDMLWDCSVEPWDSGYPGSLVTMEHRSWTSNTDHGPRVVQIYPWKQDGLSRDSVVRYLAPVGTELVVGPFSVTHELQPKMFRAMVPSVTMLSASEHVDGTWIRYRTRAPKDIPELLMVYYEDRTRSRRWRSWSPMPMYSGRLFVPRERIAKYSPMRVEMCAPDGELFCATLDDSARPGAAPIEWRQGTGTAPMTVTVPDGCAVSSVSYREEGGAVVAVSEAGPNAGCARQYQLEATRMLVSVPEECKRRVWVFCDGGTVVEVHGDVCSVRAPGVSAPWYCVVPPHLLMELQTNEALSVGLQARVVIEGRETWIDVSRRRLTAKDDAIGWAVQVPSEVRYRASWTRVAEQDGTWRRVGAGQHEVAGSGAIRAVPPKGR